MYLKNKNNKKFIVIISLFICSVQLYATSINNFINLNKCNQIINKKIFKVCYSYKYKAALAVWYQLNRKEQIQKKLRTRPRFYSEKTIPVQYRAKYKDYSYSGYDRGHLANNWDFAYSKATQMKTFSLSNIIPQNPIVNRKLWSKSERYERYIAIKLGSDNIINIIKYSQDPKRIGKDNIAVPSGFYKIIYNNKYHFEKCFYYKNYAISSYGNKLKNHLINCKDIQK